MDAQFQIRNNAQDVQDYMRDLYHWESEQKTKDAKLVRKFNKGHHDEGEPLSSSRVGLRGKRDNAREGTQNGLESTTKDGQNGAGKKTQSEGASTVPPPSSAASHTYSYAASKWDRFDIDAALAELSDESDNEGSKPTSRNQLPPGLSIDPSKPLVLTDTGKENLYEVQTTRMADKTAATPLRKTPAEPSKAVPRTPEDWKEEGNKLFKQGRFLEAQAAYTRSIETGGGSVIYANRAMARLKLHDNKGAEADASHCLLLDPTFIKAWQRRGAARKALGRLIEAVEDLEQAVRLSPASKAIQDDFAACVALLEEGEQLKRVLGVERVTVMSSKGDAYPVAVQCPTQSAAGVGDGGGIAEAGTVVGSAYAVPAAGPTSLTPPQEAMAAKDSLELSPVDMGKEAGLPAGEQQATKLPGISLAGGAGAARGNDGLENGVPQPDIHPQSAGRRDSQRTSSASAQPCIHDNRTSSPSVPHQQGQCFAGQGPSAANGEARGLSNRFPSVSAGKVEQLGVHMSEGRPVAAAPSCGLAPDAGPSRLPGPPRTGIDFEAAWKGFKKNVGREGAYLELLDPSSLPSVFKHSLTSPLLAQLLRAILEVVAADKPAHARALLQSLMQVPRFQLALLGLSRSQKQGLGQAWDLAEPQVAVHGASLQDLRSEYKL